MASKPQPKNEFKHGGTRPSLETNLLARLNDYNSMYREAAPSVTGKGAPGIPDSGLKNERVAGDYFGYGKEIGNSGVEGNANATGGLKIRGFVCGKAAMGKSDYEGENGKVAADKSFFRNGMNVVKYSTTLTGETGMRGGALGQATRHQ